MITIIRDTGLINRIGQLFGVDINLGMMYHASGIITMNLWFNIPFAAYDDCRRSGGIPDSIIEAASDVGAGKLRIFRTMILPLSLKDVVVAATFVFMSNVSSFTTPYLMGGNAPKMLGIALYDQFNRYMDYNRSAALSVIMFLICSVSAGYTSTRTLKENDWGEIRKVKDKEHLLLHIPERRINRTTAWNLSIRPGHRGGLAGTGCPPG